MIIADVCMHHSRSVVLWCLSRELPAVSEGTLFLVPVLSDI